MTSQTNNTEELEERYNTFMEVMHNEPKTVAIIVAMDEEGGIGKDGTIPWSCAADMEMFKEITQASTVIMGKETHISIGRQLPNRHNIVVSKTLPKSNTLHICEDLETAINAAPTNAVFLIGGEGIYEEGLELADFVHVTNIPGSHQADRFFPELDFDKWGLVFGFDTNVCEFMLFRKMSVDEQIMHYQASLNPS